MTRMSPALRSSLLATGVALLVLGGSRALPDHDGLRGHYGREEAAAERGESDLGDGAGRPVARLRASSAMPYFSFAHALRTRG